MPAAYPQRLQHRAIFEPFNSPPSGKQARAYKTTLHHVSCSPSKIPYVGFSPVRLQTGIQMRPSLTRSWLKCETHMHHQLDNLYASTAERPCSYGHKACLAEPVASTAFPVQRPLARRALCCRPRSSLNMASSEAVCFFQCLIFFVHWIFALRPRMGWDKQIPQFAPCICNVVPSSVPRRSCRVHMVVSSSTILAFAISAMARQPLPTHAGSHVGCVTRLQSSLYATARHLVSPSPARTFTIELSSDGKIGNGDENMRFYMMLYHRPLRSRRGVRGDYLPPITNKKDKDESGNVWRPSQRASFHRFESQSDI